MKHRLDLAWRALTGELERHFAGLGIVRAERVQRGWVIRTAGQGRGRRWWVDEVHGPEGMHGLVRFRGRLVEVHGVRSPRRLRAMGVEPDTVQEIYVDAGAPVVIEYLDWDAEEAAGDDRAGP